MTASKEVSENDKSWRFSVNEDWSVVSVCRRTLTNCNQLTQQLDSKSRKSRQFLKVSLLQSLRLNRTILNTLNMQGYNWWRKNCALKETIFSAIIMLLFLILFVTSVHCQSDSQSAGSHGSAYESIISQYYTNDPYFGSGPPSQRYSTKEEALDRLKQIIKGWVIIWGQIM